MSLSDAIDLCEHWRRCPPLAEAYAAVHGLLAITTTRPGAKDIDAVIAACGG
jgi:hypothetical protein